MRIMIRHFTSILILISFSVFPPLLTSTTKTDNEKVINIKHPEGEISSVFGTTADDELWIDSLLNKMTIRERIAQMIMPWAGGNYTSETSSDYKRLVYLAKDLKVGGFIFFKGDILNEALIINKLQQSADVPLLISSDFERGLAMRLTDATEFPYNMALAAANDPLLALEMGRIVSLESRALGIHQNYAPVADINNNADNPIINIRAYSENKDMVSQYCDEFIEGSIKGRMITTAKHFPGHGNTTTDSHQEMPVINGTQEELMNNELQPFINSIKSGVHSVMVGHLSVPAFEPANIPATLSKNIVTGLLKEKLGFKGLIVTDAMNMNAVTKHYSVAQATVLAVKAGNDIILMPPDEEIAISAVSDAVYSGEISIERINESVRKILAAKKWAGLDKERTTDISKIPSFIGNNKNNFLADEIAEKSITLVKNDEGVIPVNPSKYYTTAVIAISDDYVDPSFFNDLASQEFGYIKTISLNRRSIERDYNKAFQIASKSDIVLIPSYIKVKAFQGSIKMSDRQVKFINSVLHLSKPSVIISLGNPYLLELFPGCSTYLTSYGDAIVSQKAVMRAIVGKADIGGKLPVSIPNTAYKIGYGITSSRNILVKDISGYDFPETEKMIIRGIARETYSASSLAISSHGKLIFNRSYGNTSFSETSPAVTNDFIYDADEMTDIITTAGALILTSDGALDLDKPVSFYIPESDPGFSPVRELLYNRDKYNAGKFITAAARTTAPDNVLLREIIEKISGSSIDVFLTKRLFEPLGMRRTMFNPPPELWFYTIPVSKDSYKYMKERNAGGYSIVFTNSEDFSVFLQMLVNKGKYGTNQVINEKVFHSWYGNINEDLYISGSTGCAAWVNPGEQRTVVFLSNSAYDNRTAELEKTLPELYNSIKNNIEY